MKGKANIFHEGSFANNFNWKMIIKDALGRTVKLKMVRSNDGEKWTERNLQQKHNFCCDCAIENFTSQCFSQQLFIHLFRKRFFFWKFIFSNSIQFNWYFVLWRFRIGAWQIQTQTDKYSSLVCKSARKIFETLCIFYF